MFFVLFSNYENLPCVILEAFSCGVPVVSTNIGGISEYFPDDFGALIPVKDEYSLETEILKIYHSNKKIPKEKMHNYCVDNFGKNSIASKFSKLYFSSIKLSK